VVDRAAIIYTYTRIAVVMMMMPPRREVYYIYEISPIPKTYGMAGKLALIIGAIMVNGGGGGEDSAAILYLHTITNQIEPIN